jgi:hypothetical protein
MDWTEDWVQRRLRFLSPHAPSERTRLFRQMILVGDDRAGILGKLASRITEASLGHVTREAISLVSRHATC